MPKILCVPAINDDGWNSAIAPNLHEAPLWAIVDESDEVTFVENPVRGPTLDGERAVASVWMLGAVGVAAPEADDDLQEKFARMGVVVVAAPRAVTIRQIWKAWMALPLPGFAEGGSEGDRSEAGE